MKRKKCYVNKELGRIKEEIKSHQDAKICYICVFVEKESRKKLSKTINYRKVRDHCNYTGKYRGAAYSICNIKFTVHNKILAVFQGVVNEFERQFECLRENTEKYKTFSVPVEKEVTKIKKNGNESVFTISYKITFIDSARFMATSLSNLVDNLTIGIYKIECKDCDCFLKYESVKDNFVKYKCLSR